MRVWSGVDRGPANATKIAALATDGCPTFDEIERMLAVPDLDVVCICTPSGAHLEPAVQAARAGKHVVVENRWKSHFRGVMPSSTPAIQPASACVRSFRLGLRQATYASRKRSTSGALDA